MFNLNPFQLIGVGCYSSSWNLNWMLFSVTLLPLLACTILTILKKKDAAIAVTFLVLPTVTTTIFKIFPCDDLDDGTKFLHADYSLSCKDSSHTAWVAYGVSMIIVYPIGVLSLYAALLFKNRHKIKQSYENREKDEELMQMSFLFESYKPFFWWFEILETARRLAMTGVLGAISPGSDVQLASGIIMTFASTVTYAMCMPFIELKDNILGVLTNATIFVVMLTALILKHNEGGEGEEGVGALLIFLNVLCVAVFVGSGGAQIYIMKKDFDANKKSGAGLAMGVLKRTNTSGDDGEEVEEGRGSSLIGAGRNWLRTISSGAAELGSGTQSREERRKKREEGAPTWGGPHEEPPPPPPGNPPPNNSIFDKMRIRLEEEGRDGIEMAENPLRGEGGKNKGGEGGAVDGRKLQNLESFNSAKIRAGADGREAG